MKLLRQLEQKLGKIMISLVMVALIVFPVLWMWEEIDRLITLALAVVMYGAGWYLYWRWFKSEPDNEDEQ